MSETKTVISVHWRDSNGRARENSLNLSDADMDGSESLRECVRLFMDCASRTIRRDWCGEEASK